MRKILVETAVPGPRRDGVRRVVRVAFVAFVAFVASIVSGCSTSQVKSRSIEPRFSAVDGSGPYVWDADRGWLETDSGSWGDSEQLRVEARRAFDAGVWADALAGFLILEDRALLLTMKDLSFYIAECYYRLGHYEQALDYFRPVYRRDYPSPQLIDQARERVFDIGMAYLKGLKARSLLGFEYTSPEFGIEILADSAGGLITENPHLPFADDGLIAIADFYYDDGQYPEAVPLYDRVAGLEAEEWHDYAEYRAALAEHAQVRGVDYDQSKMRESQRRFRLYLLHHPRGDHWEDARAKVGEISEMESDKNLRIAKFYLRDSQPRACEISLREVLDRYPNSRAAREAREILRQLDESRGSW